MKGEPLTPGHWAMLKWLSSQEFQKIFRIYEKVTGPHRLYYRLTDDGIIPIALVDHAPKYVGFGDDPKFRTKWRPGKMPPAPEIVRKQWQVFNDDYLPKRVGVKPEEQGVIRWLRDGLKDGLHLPSMPAMDNGKWLFLNQEWRLPSGEKTDVIAVDVSSGRVGFFEFKDVPTKEATARKQLKTYQTYWQHHRKVLIPFFRMMLCVCGGLYGNGEAAKAKVSDEDARLFFGVARPGMEVKIKEVSLA